ncbi:hypothetical protein F4819DRAFT_507677 [Hypoxylon fuscum]|nr:hypothetical protein F4819DRAFT_507677 [Hypoxylon fuscum]
MRILTVLLVIVNLPIILILAGIPAMIIQSTNLFLNWRAFLEWVYSFYYRIYDDNNNRCVAYGLELILCKFSPQLIQAGYFILGSVLLILIIAFWHTMRGFLLCLTLVLLLGYLGRLQWVRYYDQELRAHRITRFRDLAWCYRWDRALNKAVGRGPRHFLDNTIISLADKTHAAFCGGNWEDCVVEEARNGNSWYLNDYRGPWSYAYLLGALYVEMREWEEDLEFERRLGR